MVSKGKVRHLRRLYHNWCFRDLFAMAAEAEGKWMEYIYPTITVEPSPEVMDERLYATEVDVSRSVADDDRLPMLVLFTEKGPLSHGPYF